MRWCLGLPKSSAGAASSSTTPLSDRVVFMDKGVVLEDAAPAELFGNPKHQRTREFLSRYLEDK